jgi:hypothetical protein
MRIGVNSVQGNIDAFQHTIYLDLIATQDVFGTSTPLESFETESNLWKEATVANPYAASWASVDAANRVGGMVVARHRRRSRDRRANGAASGLRMGASQTPARTECGRQRTDDRRIPVVINRAFASQFTGRNVPHRCRRAADHR